MHAKTMKNVKSMKLKHDFGFVSYPCLLGSFRVSCPCRRSRASSRSVATTWRARPVHPDAPPHWSPTKMETPQSAVPWQLYWIPWEMNEKRMKNIESSTKVLVHEEVKKNQAISGIVMYFIFIFSPHERIWGWFSPRSLWSGFGAAFDVKSLLRPVSGR